MTDPLATLRALEQELRDYADGQGAIYGSGVHYAADKLAACLAVLPKESAVDIAVGSRWKDLDSRMQRVVVVVGVQDGKIAYRNDPTGRLAYSRRARFLRAFEPLPAPPARPADTTNKG